MKHSARRCVIKRRRLTMMHEQCSTATPPQRCSSPPAKMQRVASPKHNVTPTPTATNDSVMMATNIQKCNDEQQQQQQQFVVLDGIRIRRKDGFFSATDMCNKYNGVWGSYWRTEKNRSYAMVTAQKRGVDVGALVQSDKTAGTWVPICTIFSDA